MDDAGLTFSVSTTHTAARFSSPWVAKLTTHQFVEVQAQHAFIRDEWSKGRWDAALTRSLFGMMMEQFTRTVARDLGPKKASGAKVEHVC